MLFAAFDRFVGRGLDCERLLDQPVEEKSPCLGFAPVEPKGELIEVVVELLELDAALMRADQPPLEQRSDEVDAGHDFVGWIDTVADRGDLAPIAKRRELRVAAPRRSGQTPLGYPHVREAAQTDPADAAPVFSAATATITFFPAPRPRLPSSRPPT